MDIRAAEISSILREQIRNFGQEAEVSEVGQVLSVGDGIARRCFEIGIVDQEDCDLALQVHALEVVPLPLRRRDAIADEYHRRDCRPC